MRGEGNVYRVPGSRFWHYIFSIDGERHHGSTGKADEAKARQVLQSKREAHERGDEVPREGRLTLTDLGQLLAANYAVKKNRSADTMPATFRHLVAFFGPKAKAVKLGARVESYVLHRRAEGAAEGSIRIELALLARAFKLAVQQKRLSPGKRPHIELPSEDPTAVRQGFFRRPEVEMLCGHLPAVLADVILFLFFCPWRVGAVRRLEWRDYSPTERSLTLRAALNKDKRRPVVIPVDPEHTPELMTIIERQRERRRASCPFVFHGKTCGPPRFDKKGNRRPCLGDFQKAWNTACGAIKMAGRIPHDLRRSGIKHYIEAGVPPEIVMAWSGHRTRSMLQRYNILDLSDLRRAGKMASDYRGQPATVTILAPPATFPEPSQAPANSRDPQDAAVELGAS